MALAMPIYGREHSTFAIGRRAPEGDFRRAAFGICQYPTSPLLVGNDQIDLLVPDRPIELLDGPRIKIAGCGQLVDLLEFPYRRGELGIVSEIGRIAREPKFFAQQRHAWILHRVFEVVL